ncbi:MAG TPA: RES family NAD+ phosphorylase [Mucilaginibacter sp.]|jgi:RES domain-containing protein|nr:RES family NAD+ phosphorylase [Mucilaginibacter sp.]
MILYRIGDCNYVNDLSGTGTRIFGGRWSSKGKPGVYLASSRALAVLEVLVHLQPLFIPDNFCLLEIDVPMDSIEQVDTGNLPSNWKDVSPPIEVKKIGDNFLHEKKHLILQLPSAIVPAEFNFLVNPLHKDMKKVKMLRQEPFSFDERLI